MSYTLTESGNVLTETQWLCLGMATEIEKLRRPPVQPRSGDLDRVVRGRKGQSMKTEYQYYYKRNECTAKEATDSNCICWHDEGTGPYDNTRHDDEAPFLEWRAKPSNAAMRRGESAA